MLVHGSLATGPTEWEAQRPLADQGFQLVVPTRRGYHPRSGEVGEDFLVDGEDVASLLGDGAHLVGHSYGGLAAIVAAATRPEAVYSLILAEAPTFDVAAQHPEVTRLRDQLAQLLSRPGSDREFLESFLNAVGTPLEELPPALLDELTDMAASVRRGRAPWSGRVPIDRLVGAGFPIFVVSGNHHPAFTRMCEELARHLAAEHRVVEGAGHEVQMVAGDFNALLLSVWRHARAAGPQPQQLRRQPRVQ